MSTPPSGQTRRLTGATKGVAYGEDDGVEIDFMGEDAVWLDNAYNADTNFQADEVDTTAYGDYPWGTSEPGFIRFSSNISMRHKVENGALAADVAFMEDHALTRTPFRIAVVDDRTSTTPNGIILTVTATQANSSGDFASAQDHAYTLTRASGALPPKRIINGVATAITVSS